MLLTEYNEKHQRKLDRADAREEGRKEGREESRRAFVVNMLRKGISDEEICELAECEQAFIDEVKRNV